MCNDEGLLRLFEKTFLNTPTETAVLHIALNKHTLLCTSLSFFYTIIAANINAGLIILHIQELDPAQGNFTLRTTLNFLLVKKFFTIAAIKYKECKNR